MRKRKKGGEWEGRRRQHSFMCQACPATVPAVALPDHCIQKPRKSCSPCCPQTTPGWRWWHCCWHRWTNWHKTRPRRLCWGHQTGRMRGTSWGWLPICGKWHNSVGWSSDFHAICQPPRRNALPSHIRWHELTRVQDGPKRYSIPWSLFLIFEWR